MASSSSSFLQNPEPRPPNVYAARMMSGKPNSWAAATASSIVEHAMLRGVLTPISASFSEKSLRSSVSIIACTGVPSTCTPYFSKTPLR